MTHSLNNKITLEFFRTCPLKHYFCHNKNCLIMPKSKNAEYRFLILDRCFSNHRIKYTYEDLLRIVNEKLYENDAEGISSRQLRDDLRTIREILHSKNAEVELEVKILEGKKCYYQYSDPDFSIYNNELSPSEIQNLRSTIEMLRKYRGLPTNGWLEEVVSNLEVKFGLKGKAENLVSFSQNENYEGLKYLSDIIDATINHQPLKIDYITANGDQYKHLFHPYYVKQYNGRWFVFGLDEKEDRIKNLALDRIQKFSELKSVFRKNETIDFNSYFDKVVGVTMPDESNSEEEIRLKFSPRRFKYVTSKPLHKSQTIISEEECIVSLRLYYTKELEQQLFSYGPDVEVLSPQWIRESFSNKIAECMKKYFSMQNDCIEGV